MVFWFKVRVNTALWERPQPRLNAQWNSIAVDGRAARSSKGRPGTYSWGAPTVIVGAGSGIQSRLKPLPQ